MRVKYNSLKIVLIAIIVVIILFILGIGVKMIIDKTKGESAAEQYRQPPESHDELVYGDDDLGISVEVDKALQDYQNIALLGIGTAKVEDKDGNRSDAIVIISIHRQTRDVKVFSVFRDTYLKIDDNYGLDKINHAYAFGGKNLSLKALNQNMELNIRDTVVLPWNAVRDIVDDLGGIEVEILDSEVDYLNSGLEPEDQIDAAVIAPKCDGVILVIESGATSYRAAQDVKKQLEVAGGHILGTILNKIPTEGSGYYSYYKYYGKYYGGYGRYYGNPYTPENR